MTNPTWFCGTIWQDKYLGSKEQLAEWFKLHHAKEGVIGEEISPSSGKIHYQFRIHLDRGETLKGWQELVKSFGHIEVCMEKKFTDYEKKDGNYIEWPQSYLDRFKEMPLLFWQEQLLEQWQEQDDRQILFVKDVKGGNGKSTFGKIMEARGLAEVCPVCSDDYNDYTSFCLEYPAKGYIFDIPRASSIKRRTALWSGIEQIKNGLLYEKRYKPRKVWIQPPKVIVFTNEDEPPWELLSLDRWRVFDVEQYVNPITNPLRSNWEVA